MNIAWKEFTCLIRYHAVLRSIRVQIGDSHANLVSDIETTLNDV